MTNLYARRGEVVTCERGHEVGSISRDITRGEVTRGDEVIGQEVQFGSLFLPCKICGAPWTGFFPDGVGAFHFKDEGFRR